MVKRIKQRESNFELLRILAILGIIFCHIISHAIIPQLNDDKFVSANTYFNTFNFFYKLYIVDFGVLLGQTSNVIFILISGYFLCSKKKIDVVKQAKKLLIQALFVSFLFVLISFGYHYFFTDFRNSLLLTHFSNGWWFIGYYLFIIYCGVFFLNNYLSKLSREKYRNILIIAFSVLNLYFIRNSISGISTNLAIMLNGLFIYSLGGYIRKYNPFKNIKVYHFIIFILITYIITFISFYNYTNNNINTGIYNEITSYHPQFNLYDEWNIACLVIGVSIFEIFRRIKIKPNRVINYVASSVFMIYLVHDNTFTRGIFYEIDWVKLCNNDYIMFIGLLLFVVLIVFIIGVIIYVLYNLFMKLVDRYCKKYLST